MKVFDNELSNHGVEVYTDLYKVEVKLTRMGLKIETYHHDNAHIGDSHIVHHNMDLSSIPLRISIDDLGVIKDEKYHSTDFKFAYYVYTTDRNFDFFITEMKQYIMKEYKRLKDIMVYHLLGEFKFIL